MMASIGMSVNNSQQMYINSNDLVQVANVVNHTCRLIFEIQTERISAVLYIISNYSDAYPRKYLNTTFQNEITYTDMQTALYVEIIDKLMTGNNGVYENSLPVVESSLNTLDILRERIKNREIVDPDDALQQYNTVSMTLLRSIYLSSNSVKFDPLIGLYLTRLGLITQLYNTVDLMICSFFRISMYPSVFNDFINVHEYDEIRYQLVLMYINMIDDGSENKANKLLYGPIPSEFRHYLHSIDPMADYHLINITYVVGIGVQLIHIYFQQQHEDAELLISLITNNKARYYSQIINVVICVLGVVVTLALGIIIGWQVMKPFDKLRQVKAVMKKQIIELSNQRDAINRLIPYQLATMIQGKEVINLKLGDHAYHLCTIMFSDIMSFTTISERLSPVEVFRLINAVYTQSAPHYEACGGMVDKFMGDGVVIVFADVNSACMCADLIHGEITAISADHRIPSRMGFELQVGVGIHSGDVIVGTVGQPQRMDITIISDAVNIASRLQSLTRDYCAQTLLSEASYQKMIDLTRVRYIGSSPLKGKRTNYKVYEFTKREYVTPEFKLAIEALEAQSFDSAKLHLSKHLANHESDAVAKNRTKRCSGELASPLSPSSVVRSMDALELLDMDGSTSTPTVRFSAVTSVAPTPLVLDSSS